MKVSPRLQIELSEPDIVGLAKLLGATSDEDRLIRYGLTPVESERMFTLYTLLAKYAHEP